MSGPGREDPSVVCPACGHESEPFRCKILCPNCHAVVESCSDGGEVPPRPSSPPRPAGSAG